MTEVKMQMLYKGFSMDVSKGFSMDVSGHAERSPDEQMNECCAAVSTLCAAALEAFTRFRDEQKGFALKTENESGHVSISICTMAVFEPELEGMVNVLRAGFETIESTYPGRIHVGWEK